MASDAEPSSEESQFTVQSGDEENLWEIVGILAEKNKQYKVKWAGNDPKTNKPWGNSWVKKSDVTPDVVREWKEKQARKQRRKSDKLAPKASKLKVSGSPTSNRTTSTLRPQGRSSVATTVKPEPSPPPSRLSSASPPRRSPSIPLPKVNNKRKLPDAASSGDDLPDVLTLLSRSKPGSTGQPPKKKRKVKELSLAEQVYGISSPPSNPTPKPPVNGDRNRHGKPSKSTSRPRMEEDNVKRAKPALSVTTARVQGHEEHSNPIHSSRSILKTSTSEPLLSNASKAKGKGRATEPVPRKRSRPRKANGAIVVTDGEEEEGSSSGTERQHVRKSKRVKAAREEEEEEEEEDHTEIDAGSSKKPAQTRSLISGPLKKPGGRKPNGTTSKTTTTTAAINTIPITKPDRPIRPTRSRTATTTTTTTTTAKPKSKQTAPAPPPTSRMLTPDTRERLEQFDKSISSLTDTESAHPMIPYDESDVETVALDLLYPPDEDSPPEKEKRKKRKRPSSGGGTLPSAPALAHDVPETVIEPLALPSPPPRPQQQSPPTTTTTATRIPGSIPIPSTPSRQTLKAMMKPRTPAAGGSPGKAGAVVVGKGKVWRPIPQISPSAFYAHLPSSNIESGFGVDDRDEDWGEERDGGEDAPMSSIEQYDDDDGDESLEKRGRRRAVVHSVQAKSSSRMHTTRTGRSKSQSKDEGSKAKGREKDKEKGKGKAAPKDDDDYNDEESEDQDDDDNEDQDDADADDIDDLLADKVQQMAVKANEAWEKVRQKERGEQQTRRPLQEIITKHRSSSSAAAAMSDRSVSPAHPPSPGVRAESRDISPSPPHSRSPDIPLPTHSPDLPPLPSANDDDGFDDFYMDDPTMTQQDTQMDDEEGGGKREQRYVAEEDEETTQDLLHEMEVQRAVSRVDSRSPSPERGEGRKGVKVEGRKVEMEVEERKMAVEVEERKVEVKAEKEREEEEEEDVPVDVSTEPQPGTLHGTHVEEEEEEEEGVSQKAAPPLAQPVSVRATSTTRGSAAAKTKDTPVQPPPPSRKSSRLGNHASKPPSRSSSRLGPNAAKAKQQSKQVLESTQEEEIPATAPSQREESSQESNKTNGSNDSTAQKEHIAYMTLLNAKSEEIGELGKQVAEERSKNEESARRIAQLEDQLRAAQESADSEKHRADLVLQKAQVAETQLSETESKVQAARETWGVQERILEEEVRKQKSLQDVTQRHLEDIKVLYMEETGRCDVLRKAKKSLAQELDVARTQASEGVKAVRAMLEVRIKEVEDDRNRWRRAAQFILDKDARTNDDVRRRAAEEPELRYKCQQYKIKLANSRGQIEELERSVEEWRGTAGEWEMRAGEWARKVVGLEKEVGEWKEKFEEKDAEAENRQRWMSDNGYDKDYEEEEEGWRGNESESESEGEGEDGEEEEDDENEDDAQRSADAAAPPASLPNGHAILEFHRDHRPEVPSPSLDGHRELQTQAAEAMDEDENDEEAKSGEDEEDGSPSDFVYRCQWRLESDKFCNAMFRTDLELEEHIFERGHVARPLTPIDNLD